MWNPTSVVQGEQNRWAPSVSRPPAPLPCGLLGIGIPTCKGRPLGRLAPSHTSGAHLQFSPAHVSVSVHLLPTNSRCLGLGLNILGEEYGEAAHTDSGCWCRGFLGAGYLQCRLRRGAVGLGRAPWTSHRVWRGSWMEPLKQPPRSKAGPSLPSSQSAVTLLDCSAVPSVRAVGSGGVLTSTQILSTCRWKYLYRVIFTIALPDRCHHPILRMWGSRPSAQAHGLCCTSFS